MDCYIATFYKYNNYGTRLQNYALCNAVKSLGLNPKTIYLIDKNEKNLKRHLQLILTYLPICTKSQKIWKIERIKKTVFADFNDKLNFLKLTYDDLEQLDFSNSIAIVGSDQVWSPKHLNNNEVDQKLFFLDFISENKRYSYAPSFGVSRLESSEKSIYDNKFSHFNALSVREVEGKQILYDNFHVDAQIVPDPVFLFMREEWLQILKIEEKNVEKKYILTYFLGKPDKELFERINKYAKRNNLVIVNISGNYYQRKSDIVDPRKFIQLINDSEIVFTDSFHATAFSIILRKSFFVFKRNDVKQISRINTLLNKFQLENRLLSISDIECGRIGNSKINYNDFFEIKLSNEKEIGMKFLNNIVKEVNQIEKI